MQNLKKKILILCLIVFIISIFLYLFIPYLAYQASKDISDRNYKRAAILNYATAGLIRNPLKKGHFYLTAGDCWLESKNIPAAINSYENAEKYIEIMGSYERNRLTDLYIINNDSQKIDERGAKYKLLALNENWEEALNEINSLIENSKTGIIIDGQVYADALLYIQRAIIYKNLNKEKLAEKDFNTAIKLEPKEKNDFKEIYNNKNYFKDYYENIKNALQ